MISFLLDQGAELNSSKHLPICSQAYESASTTPELDSLIPSMRVVLRHIDMSHEFTEEWVIYVFNTFYGTPEEVAFLLQHFCPSFYQVSKEIRLRVAISLARCLTERWMPVDFTSKIIQMVLRMDALEPDDFKFCEGIISTLIHCIAR